MKKRNAKKYVADLLSGTSDDRQFVVALQRGMEILRALGAKGASLGNTELVERTRLPKATVSRLTYTLSVLGYIHYDELAGRYTIGPGAISLGYCSLAGNVVRHIAQPFMRELAEETGLAVALGTRNKHQMVYLGSERGDEFITLPLTQGSLVPIETTSMGHAYLASLPEGERELLVEMLMREAPRQSWPKLKGAIRRSLEQIAENGFCMVAGLWHPHVNAAAVPFLPADGSAPVAFTCGGISYYVNEKRLAKELGPRLVALADRTRRCLERGETRTG